MNLAFASLHLTPIETIIVAITGIGFILLFGITSAKGGFQDLIKTTLDNDEKLRQIKQKDKG